MEVLPGSFVTPIFRQNYHVLDFPSHFALLSWESDSEDLNSGLYWDHFHLVVRDHFFPKWPLSGWVVWFVLADNL